MLVPIVRQKSETFDRKLLPVLIFSALAFLAVIVLATPAKATERESGIGLGFVQMQRLWQGLVEKPRMTTCRLATRQTYKKKQICVYSGANHTLVAIYNSAGAYCNNELRCKYDPDRSKSVAGFVKQFRASQK